MFDKNLTIGSVSVNGHERPDRDLNTAGIRAAESGFPNYFHTVYTTVTIL
jgi:hypothetical protein